MSLQNLLIDISATHKDAAEAVDMAISKVKLALSKEKFLTPKGQEYVNILPS